MKCSMEEDLCSPISSQSMPSGTNIALEQGNSLSHQSLWAVVKQMILLYGLNSDTYEMLGRNGHSLGCDVNRNNFRPLAMAPKSADRPTAEYLL